MENRIAESEKLRKLQELEKRNRAPEKIGEKSELVVSENAILKRVEIQPIVERHEQKFIKEIHEQTIHEVVEQPIVRRVYQQPIFRRIGENLYEEVQDTASLTLGDQLKRDVVIVGDELKTVTQAVADEVRKDAKIVKREATKGAEVIKKEAVKGAVLVKQGTEKLEKEAAHLKRVAKRRGYFDREFLLPLGMLFATGVGMFLYNKYYIRRPL